MHRFTRFALLVPMLVACGRVNYEAHVALSPSDAAVDVLAVDALADDAAPDAALDAEEMDSSVDATSDMTMAEPGVFVSPTSGLVTNEHGSIASFEIWLASSPSATVFITVSSLDLTEGAVAPRVLAFTSANWDAPQTVQVTGADDAAADGDVAYSVDVAAAVSADLRYSGIDADDVTVTNVDDDSPGVTVSRLSGLELSESGETDTFSLSLNTAPAADVTIAISASDASEAVASPALLVFTSADYASPHVVTVTGVDDLIADGDQAFTILTGNAMSSDPGYADRAVPDVSGINVDNETPGIRVASAHLLETSEGGVTALFAVSLQSQPLEDVMVPVSSTDPSEGMVSPAALTFTAANWNVGQVVVVTGVDDIERDGNQLYEVALGPSTSADGNYDALFATPVELRNLDDDAAALIVGPTTGLLTTESGGTDTFSVRLNFAPTATVLISVASSDATEGSVSPATLTFTTMNWNVDQGVTLTGVDDGVADGNQLYEAIVHVQSSLDAEYAALADRHVSVTNIDRGLEQVVVSPTSGLATNEAGATAQFSVVLSSAPSADVTVSIASNMPTEGVAAPASLTFTTGNWSVPQTVTVTGVDDGVVDGNLVYTVVTGDAVSTDPGYDGRVVEDVTVTNFNTTCSPWFRFTGGACNVARSKISLTSGDPTDLFGYYMDISADGSTLVLSAIGNASSATGVGGLETDNSAPGAGAVYVFRRTGAVWAQEAFIKASNTESSDRFGSSVAVSADGNVLAVGASNEDSNALGINGDQTNNLGGVTGAIYMFRRTGSTWAQEAYMHATRDTSFLGVSVDISSDGNVVVAGAMGDYYPSSAQGAAYVFRRVAGLWTNDARLQPAVADSLDSYGVSISMSDDGNTVALGSAQESSAATGINGNAADNSAVYSGAVCVFHRSGGVWTQEAYIKASNTSADDRFSTSTLSSDGNLLAVGAAWEDSASTLVGGDQLDNSAPNRGAVYVFTRTGSTWSQSSYVKGSTTYGEFGYDLVLTPDGTTLAVANINGLTLFSRTMTSWSEQSFLPVPFSDRSQIAYSSNGAYAVQGASNEPMSGGAVWIFER